LLDPRDPQSQEEDYKNRLKALEWNISNLPATPSTSRTWTSTEPSAGLPLEVEVYQVATLIYLARASQSPWEASTKLESLIDRAFTVPTQAHFCTHFFPLFVLSCEARTDEQRIAVLNLLARTETAVRARSLGAFQTQIQALWVQQDLHADGDLIVNYLELMKAVISANSALPSFV
jgi:hypothetical protein